MSGTLAQDHLARIVARKQAEVERRLRRGRPDDTAPPPLCPAHDLIRQLRRERVPKVIAELKLASPSAGAIRARAAGELARIGEGFARAGAAAVSVLCDRVGFAGTPLDVRRVSSRVSVPVLFKEFVLDTLQVELARSMGASYVLLLARVLDDGALQRLVRTVRELGMEPVVEAADALELTRALATDAAIVGINARDLRSFEVDGARATELVDRIPPDRVAVFMSGVRSVEALQRLSATRADAVLIGEGLMRAREPGERLASWLQALQ